MFLIQRPASGLPTPAGLPQTSSFLCGRQAFLQPHPSFPPKPLTLALAFPDLSIPIIPNPLLSTTSTNYAELENPVLTSCTPASTGFFLNNSRMLMFSLQRSRCLDCLFRKQVWIGAEPQRALKTPLLHVLHIKVALLEHVERK